MAGRHWEHQPRWRPTHDIGGRYTLNPDKLVPNAPPSTPNEALAEVRESGEFDGYFNLPVFEEMVMEAAEERFPECFGLADPEPLPTEAIHTQRLGSPALEAFFADYTRTNGQVDWNEVARNTTYVTSATPLPLEAVPEPAGSPDVDQQRKVS